MVKALIIIAIFACCAALNLLMQTVITTEYRPVAWRLVAEADARTACVRPVELAYTTNGADCYRTPTAQKNYCPF